MNNLKSFTVSILFAVLCLLPIRAFAQSTAVGWVTSVSGQVFYTLKGDTAKQAAKLGQEVYNGMTFMTEKTSAVRILFQGDNVLTLSQNSKLTITEYLSSPQRTVSKIDLLWGRVRAAVQTKISSARGDLFEVRTKNAVAGVRGSLLGLEYDPDSNTTQAGCGSGECYLKEGDQTFTIPAGQTLEVVNDKVGSPKPMSEDDPGSFDPNEPYDENDGEPWDTPADEGLGETGDVGGDSKYDKSSFQENGFSSFDPGYDPINLDATIDGPGTPYENFGFINEPFNPYFGHTAPNGSFPGGFGSNGGGPTTSGPGQ